MIIVEAAPATDSSDAASTNTLVTDELHKLPCHLVKLVYSSLFFALLSFIFVLVACVSDNPTLTAATILAFVFTVPHHGATILRSWLQLHQTESIFPFTPLSPRAIAYSIFLIVAWVSSTTMCAISLNNSSHLRYTYCEFLTSSDGIIGPQTPEYCTESFPGLSGYWPSFLATLLSGLELVLVTSITVICWLYRPRKTPSTTPHPPSPSITSETKIISAWSQHKTLCFPQDCCDCEHRGGFLLVTLIHLTNDTIFDLLRCMYSTSTPTTKDRLTMIETFTVTKALPDHW